MHSESRRVRLARAAMILLAIAPFRTMACTVEGVPLSFGSVNPLDLHPVDGATTVTVTCPADTPYTLTLSAGGGTYNARQMSSGAHQLNYQVFSDAGQTVVLGDGSAGTATLGGAAGPTGSVQNMYGQVPVQQYAVPGAYSDILLVTITY